MDQSNKKISTRKATVEQEPIQTRSGLRILRGATQNPKIPVSASSQPPRSAFARMLNHYCDELEREIERVRKS